MDGWMCTNVLPFPWNSISRVGTIQTSSMFSLLWEWGKPVFSHCLSYQIWWYLFNSARDCPRSSFSPNLKKTPFSYLNLNLKSCLKFFFKSTLTLLAWWHWKLLFLFIFSCRRNELVSFDLWASECREDKPSARCLGCEPMPSFRQNEEQARLMWRWTQSSCFRNSDMRIHGSVVCVVLEC